MSFYSLCLVAMFVAALATFFYLKKITAPYGRHHRQGFGVDMPARLGWMLMECPAVFFFLWIYCQGIHATQPTPLMLLFMWQFHYLYRTFIFPFRLNKNSKKMPLFIVLSSFFFNVWNAYLNAHWLTHFAPKENAWLHSPAFMLGGVMFALGFYTHYRADGILIRLRKRHESHYDIPQGFLFRWISSPNYLGEILTWSGFALAAWSLAGLAFALFTVANLLPRALSHLRWYQQQFNDFPSNRKALIPYIL